MTTNAVEEFLTLKESAVAAHPGAFARFGQHFSHAAVGGLATAAVGAGITGAAMAVNHILDAATKSSDFKQMLAANEDLHEHYNTDPKRFNMMFSTLRTMNPEFSKDPLVAGAFMRQMHESPTGIAGIAGEALKHRGDFPDHMMDSLSQYGRAGAQSGIGESFKQRSGKELLSQKKPELDYAHGLTLQQQSLGHGLKAEELEMKDRHHDEDLGEKLRASQLKTYTRTSEWQPHKKPVPGKATGKWKPTKSVEDRKY